MLRELCASARIAFFDAALLNASSVVDGVHLDAGQHEVLGRVAAECIAGIIFAP